MDEIRLVIQSTEFNQRENKVIEMKNLINKVLNLLESPVTKSVADALQDIVRIHGKSYAMNLERLMRLETAHFSSSQWEINKTAGMVATSSEFPFGWNSLKEFTNETKIAPFRFEIKRFPSVNKTYITFPDEYTFTMFLSWFIQKKRSGDIYEWNVIKERDPAQYERYKKLVQSITTKIIV